MKHSLFLTIPFIIFAVACKETNQAAPPPATAPGYASIPETHGGNANDAALVVGKVTETMSSGGYTYVQIDDGAKKIWAAAPEFSVTVGDEVTVPQGSPMQNFKSKTLDRTFEVIYFVSNIQAGTDVSSANGDAQQPDVHGTAPQLPTAQLQFDDIKRAEGGQTVAELFAQRTDLTGKNVTVRAKVAKYSANVMGKNWLHVQDGTGGDGTNDLTVTTNATAEVGNTVLVQGILTLNKDFGFGYKYDVIVENATVNVE